MSIIPIIVVLFVVGLLLWGIRQFPIDARIMNMIYVIVVIALVLWLLQQFGLLRGTGIHV
jgi:hypothetical protein